MSKFHLKTWCFYVLPFLYAVNFLHSTFFRTPCSTHLDINKRGRTKKIRLNSYGKSAILDVTYGGPREYLQHSSAEGQNRTAVSVCKLKRTKCLCVFHLPRVIAVTHSWRTQNGMHFNIQSLSDAWRRNPKVPWRPSMSDTRWRRCTSSFINISMVVL
jgi:hypothetical protein